MTWISVPLRLEEKEALHRLANSEFRNSRSQAALIIRAELERLGLLQPDQTVKKSTKINQKVANVGPSHS